jgi:DUF1680 family protein
LKQVCIQDAFWSPHLETNRTVTLPDVYQKCKKTGRIDAFKLNWKPGKPNPPHVFWDSDVAKWLEAACYSLATHPEAKLEKLLTGVVNLIVKAQQPDGYLNVHFTLVEPDRRWANLRDNHELYCAGHLMEAAVAHYEATGRDELLRAMCRYADYIDSVFGRGKGKKRGYPGHEEIELALVKMYHATGEQRYLNISRFFVDERGRRPLYFDVEARARGEDPKQYGNYHQAHLPVRDQKTADGHAVRAMYLYCAMADVASQTGDKTLAAACKRLWENVTRRRMYITGGVGSTADHERFTTDYDLPNETAYAETCAAIGLVFWANRMFHLDPDARYTDVMERALYNGVISGVSMDGRKFFYDNPLTVCPKGSDPARKGPSGHVRQEWFGCSCCPTNIVRMLASLGKYVYSQGRNEIYVHLYIAGSAEIDLAGRKVLLTQKTRYPWKEKVRLTVRPEKPGTFTVAVRIPGWCRSASLKVNGRAVNLARITKKGYAKVKRLWKSGDTIELTLPMPVERIEANPNVRMNSGKVALQRGPVVYCLEEIDNGPNLSEITLPADASLRARYDKDLLGGVTVITAKARRRDDSSWKDCLYRTEASRMKTVNIQAVPYFAWCNRKPGEMLVWIRQG